MSTECPKCGGTMERGFVLTPTGWLGAVFHREWIEGVPEWSVRSGLRRKGKKTAGPVATFRCNRCGYRESYAVESPAASPPGSLRLR